MKIQQQISEQINASRIGSKLKVVIDRKDGRYFSGRTEFDSPEVDNDVWIESENNHLKPGDFITAKITGAEAFDLFAVPVD